MMEENSYIKAFGISYAGTLPKIRKSENILQPIFEAFTNSLEAIQMSENKGKGVIIIRINLVKSLFSEEERYFDFDSIQVEDNGIGFNEIRVQVAFNSYIFLIKLNIEAYSKMKRP
jgi:nitrogen-specific signal transduction histidine kinase